MSGLCGSKVRAALRLIKQVRFGKTAAVIGFSGAPCFRRIVPIKDLVVMLCLFVANFLVVTGPPDVLINPKSALPAFIDQPREGRDQVFFHRTTDGIETTWPVAIVNLDRFQPLRPCLNRGDFVAGNIHQVGSGKRGIKNRRA